MKHAISTTALVLMLLGTGMLVFNALGLCISVAQVNVSPGGVPAGARTDSVYTWYLDLWTLPQRVWMTLGCMLIAGGRLFDARFHRV